MSHHLVITAVGTDRPGICNQLTKVVTHSGCNIVDSRIALFGKEFTLIMLVSGDMNAITKVETLLPSIGSEHDLMVIMKRTAPHQTPHYTYKIEASVHSDDKRGITDAVTEFFSDHNISIAELSAQTLSSTCDTQGKPSNQFLITLSGVTEQDLDPEQLRQNFDLCCNHLSAQGQIEIIASQSQQ